MPAFSARHLEQAALLVAGRDDEALRGAESGRLHARHGVVAGERLGGMSSQADSRGTAEAQRMLDAHLVAPAPVACAGACRPRQQSDRRVERRQHLLLHEWKRGSSRCSGRSLTSRQSGPSRCSSRL